MADQSNPAGVGFGLLLQPVECAFKIFGKARQRGKAVTVAGTMVARVYEKQCVAGPIEGAGQGQHHLAVASPAMQDDQRWSRRSVGRNKPAL